MNNTELIKNLVVYENGGETLDRYTIIHKKKWRVHNHSRLYYAVGADANGISFFQHCEAQRGKHLGKVIPFVYLSGELQQRIINNF